MEPVSPRVMLAKYGLAAARRRGQNFLVDRNVARKVVSAVAAGPGDVVVEIGPGFGAITFGLAETGAEVIAVEIDSGIVRAFREEYGEVPGVSLVGCDFLSFDLGEAARSRGSDGVVVAGNLPFSVTSPVIRRLTEHKSIVKRAVLMVQAEVGGRIAAAPGSVDYSALSAVARYHAAVRPLFVVRRTCFYPRPRVDSRLIEMDFTAAPPRSSDPALYSDVVHAAFQKRRKMLRQSLGPLLAREGVTGPELSEVTGVDLARRGESLSVDEFDALASALGHGAKGAAGAQ